MRLRSRTRYDCAKVVIQREHVVSVNVVAICFGYLLYVQCSRVKTLVHVLHQVSLAYT